MAAVRPAALEGSGEIELDARCGIRPADPTPEEAWEYVNELWEGDPGGRGWQVRVAAGATWLSLRDSDHDPARGGGPEPTFGFGEPPAGESAWEEPGY